MFKTQNDPTVHGSHTHDKTQSENGSAHTHSSPASFDEFISQILGLMNIEDSSGDSCDCSDCSDNCSVNCGDNVDFGTYHNCQVCESCGECHECADEAEAVAMDEEDDFDDEYEFIEYDVEVPDDVEEPDEIIVMFDRADETAFNVVMAEDLDPVKATCALISGISIILAEKYQLNDDEVEEFEQSMYGILMEVSVKKIFSMLCNPPKI